MAIQHGRPGHESQQGGSYATSFGLTNRKYPSKKLSLKDEGLRVIILPSRDTGMNPNDEAWAASTMPYRHTPTRQTEDDITITNPTSKFGQFTSWYQPIEGYFMFGVSAKGSSGQKRSFISPYMMGETAKTGVDALNDVYWHIWRQVKKDQGHPLFPLINKVGSDFAYLTPRSRFVALNVLIEDKEGKGENGWTQCVLITSGGAHNRLICHGEDNKALGELNIPAGRNTPIRGDGFDDFELGDVTNVRDAVIGRIAKVTFVEKGQPAPAIQMIPQNRVVQRINLVDAYGQAWVNKILTNRCPINEENWKGVPTYSQHTYEEMAGFMRDDGMVPLDILREVCGKYLPGDFFAKAAPKLDAGYGDDDDVPMDEDAAPQAPSLRRNREEAQPPVRSAPVPQAFQRAAQPDAPAHPISRSLPQNQPSAAGIVLPDAKSHENKSVSSSSGADWDDALESEFKSLYKQVMNPTPGVPVPSTVYTRFGELSNRRPPEYK